VTFRDKPFSQACENNKAPILAILAPLLRNKTHLLEIGSGTGQHAVWLAPQLPQLIWQTSDLIENHSGILRWLNDHPAANLRDPIALDVMSAQWPDSSVDSVFSANTAHIMAWHEVEAMFEKVSTNLPFNGIFGLYGPMKYAGKHTSESNRLFDLRLRERATHRGIREFHEINQLALNGDLILLDDHAMPANNRLLIWQKFM
jgi:cyclopropane fatty-acyl-phospholipid synthase-like methyltransferase